MCSSACANGAKPSPDLAIRSTFIVGFPGETEAEFEELLAFLEEAELDRVGCFAYSAVEGAAANALPDPVDPETQQVRRTRFMDVQARISARKLAAKVGATLDVLVDGHEERGRGRARTRVAIARSAADAPEIDGVVRIVDGGGLARRRVRAGVGHRRGRARSHRPTRPLTLRRLGSDVRCRSRAG